MLHKPDVNIANITRLANFIADGNLPYDQTQIEYCIWGNCNAMLGRRDDLGFGMGAAELQAFLGINALTCAQVVAHMPPENPVPTRSDAVAMLRRLAATGEVDWCAKSKNTC